MQNCHFINFDITVRGTSAPYSIMAHFAGSVAEGVFDLESTQPEWQSTLLQLGNMAVAPGNRMIVEAGSALFDELMAGDVRSLWARARAALNEPGVSGLRLRLALYPPSVASLPWECLYDPDRGELFAASGRTPLVRIENQDRYLGTPRSLRTELPINVLIACPDDPNGIIDIEQAYQTVDWLRSFGETTVRVEMMTGRFGLVDLSRRLDETGADILHVIAHGEPEGLLLWHDETPAFMPAHTVRVALERPQQLKLVLLNACLTGQLSDQLPFVTVGSQLLQTGIPAVIAMQFEIEDRAAFEFSRFLYEALLAGPCPGAIDVATGTARSNLYMRYPDFPIFGTPVLWMNAHDGQIFTLDPADRDRLSRIEPVAKTYAEYLNAPLSADGMQDGSDVVEPPTVDPLPYMQWLARRQTDITQHEDSSAFRLLRFEWERRTSQLAAFLEQPSIGPEASAEVQRLQRQIDALADAICADEESDEAGVLVKGR